MIAMTSRRRPIGQILQEGGFLSQAQLELALEEQRRGNERLGEVLVRLGMLEPGEVRAALSIQEQLSDLEQALTLAAGVREMLGSLLVRCGKLSAEQLELALDEQRRSGGKLGEVCLRLGLLQEGELNGVLAFQRQQEREGQAATPLRLGELLVTAGYITRRQLEDALGKQAASGKKLGEVLVEAGYAKPAQIHHGLRLQQLLVSSALAAVLSLSALTLGGCGGGGGGQATPTPPLSSTGVSSAPAAPQQASQDFFTVTDDGGLGLIKPDFLYSSDNDRFWSIQANVAKSVTDIDTLSVYRIVMPKSGAPLPPLNRTFSIEGGGALERFPGDFLVFNGLKSTRKKVESGTITFSADSSASGRVTGSFEVTLTDYDAPLAPAPQYRLKGAFHFVMGTYGPVNQGV
ncbi:hypothetical protein [Geomonas sp.]|uniref:hypothetical protein n=1 Tax=Geomonas sp. TaxID=2651584 RepID=UPI002B483E31|nr:hypothetical protein [Geomonas sp.]HJV33930.1 hypothetical protein [Geomonas sp.]